MEKRKKGEAREKREEKGGFVFSFHATGRKREEKGRREEVIREVPPPAHFSLALRKRGKEEEGMHLGGEKKKRREKPRSSFFLSLLLPFFPTRRFELNRKGGRRKGEGSSKKKRVQYLLEHSYLHAEAGKKKKEKTREERKEKEEMGRVVWGLLFRVFCLKKGRRETEKGRRPDFFSPQAAGREGAKRTKKGEANCDTMPSPLSRPGGMGKKRRGKRGRVRKGERRGERGKNQRLFPLAVREKKRKREGEGGPKGKRRGKEVFHRQPISTLPDYFISQISPTRYEKGGEKRGGKKKGGGGGKRASLTPSLCIYRGGEGKGAGAGRERGETTLCILSSNV